MGGVVRRVVVAIALCASACAGSGAESAPRMQIARSAVELIVIVPPPPELPFDPRSARLAHATGELADIVGHPVTFELDAALLPEFRSSFEEELIRSIENAARDLASLRKSAPRVFRRSAGMLERIACRYRAAAREASGAFDTGRRTLVITEPPGQAWVQPGVVLRALEEEFEAFLDQRYRGAMPDSVPASEHGAYFEYLTLTRPGYGNLSERRARLAQGERTEVDRVASDPHATTILRVARLGEIVGVGQDALAIETRAWLVSEAAWFQHTYETRGELVKQIPPDCAFRRAEAGWVRWLNGNFASLTDEQQVVLARVAFPPRGRCGASDACLDQPPWLPGFDRIAFGLSVVDRWRADGRPAEGQGKRFELEDQVVCPHFRRDDLRRSRNRGCGQGFYQQALATGASRSRFAAELSRRADPVLIDETFTNSDSVPADRVVALWRAMEPRRAEWLAASRTIVEHLLPEREYREPFVQEAKRLWRDAADKRGVALWLIAESEKGLDFHYSDPRWARFREDYGEPISQSVLGSLLDLGPAALRLVPALWPAIAPGFSRVDAIAARLDRFMDDPGVKATRDGEPGRTLRGLAARMCADHAHQELAKLHARVEQRARSHGDEAATLAPIVQDLSQCKAP
jgi:hypothetical protein